LLAQLERMAEEWRRWQAELSREPGPGAPGHVLLADLTEEVQKRIAAASAAVLRLQRAVVAELAQVQPRRAARIAFREV
jgi:hypothetical protein